jgi:hypothetical protein
LLLVRKALGKIFPRGIVALDKPDFLFTPPSLDFFLARNGVANVAEYLEVDQAKDAVSRRESWNEPLAMFDHSALEIARHAGVQISRPTGENVNAVRAVHFRLGKSRSLTPFANDATGFGMTRGKTVVRYSMFRAFGLSMRGN